MNPYEPPESQVDSPTRRHRLTGFPRGAIEGVVWSSPFVFMMTLFISSYGTEPPSILTAFLSSLQITAIWSVCAGLVAMVRERSKAKGGEP